MILRTVLEGAALAGFAALICALFPRLRAGQRAILWWLVGAKLLLGLVPIPAVAIAALPARAAIAPAAKVEALEPIAIPLAASAGTLSAPRADLALWIWIAGATLLSLAAIPGWRRARRLVATGVPLEGPAWGLAIARASGAAGLRRPPRVLAVPGLDTPLVTGLLRPAVLLPAEGLDRLVPEEVEMTLAHEMAHVARGDLWLGLVPALARRVFFFHPAAWIAEREYALAREAACDEIVLGRDGADPAVYGRLLLRVTTAGVSAATIPMSRHSMLRRRLVMIETMVRRSSLGRAGWALVAVAALAFVPVRLVAKEAGESRCLDIGNDRDTAYIITEGKSHTMCGDMDDIALAKKQRRPGEDLIWFRVDGNDWVVRDPGLVADAQRMFHGVSEVGAMQGEIGAKQGAIGEKQGRIGMEQGKIGMEQAEVALQQAREQMRRAELDQARMAQNADAERKAQAELQAELARAEAQRKSDQDARSAEEISRRMAELSAQMEVLGRQQSELGEKQSALSERMQRELVEAQRALSEMLERAMRDGTARQVN